MDRTNHTNFRNSKMSQTLDSCKKRLQELHIERVALELTILNLEKEADDCIDIFCRKSDDIEYIQIIKDVVIKDGKLKTILGDRVNGEGRAKEGDLLLVKYKDIGEYIGGAMVFYVKDKAAEGTRRNLRRIGSSDYPKEIRQMIVGHFLADLLDYP